MKKNGRLWPEARCITSRTSGSKRTTSFAPVLSSIIEAGRNRCVWLAGIALIVGLTLSAGALFAQEDSQAVVPAEEIHLPEEAEPSRLPPLEIADGQRAIELTGDRLIYHPATDEVVAINGLVTYNSYTLQADLIRFYLESNELHAEGNVVVREGREGSLARAVSYNWGREVWQFEDMESDITGRGIEGIVFFRGDNVFRDQEKTEIHRAFLTTCDLDEPHYHIEARKIEIYPGKRLILHNLSFHDFNIRWFTISHYVIFLDRREQLPFLPIIGHSSADGYSVNFFYNYYFGPESFGTVYVDWWQKRGWGLGFRHFLEREAASERGELYLYYTDLQQGDNTLTGQIRYRRDLDPHTNLVASLDYRGVPGEPQDRYSGQVAITHELGAHQGRWDISFDSNLRTQRDSIQSNLKYTYDFGRKLTGSLLLDYSRVSDWGKSLDERLRYLVSLTKVDGDYTYVLRYESYEDLGTYGIDPGGRRFIYKMPEFEVSNRRTRLGQSDFRYQTGLIYGHYWEEETDVIEDRLRLWLDVDGRSSLGPDTDVRTNLRFEQDFYGNSFARYIWAAGVRVDHRLTSDLNLSLNYDRRDYDGATPFRFDYTTRQADALGATLEYRADPWRVTVESGYDFLKETYQDGTIRVGYDFDSNNRLFLRGSYDFGKGDWTGLRLEFDNSIELTPEWRLDFDGNWNLLTGQISGLKVGVVRDLHCREISLIYDNDRDTFWLEYSIKAFPTEKFVLGG